MPPSDCAAGQRQVGEVLGQRARRLRLEFELPERHGRAATRSNRSTKSEPWQAPQVKAFSRLVTLK